MSVTKSTEQSNAIFPTTHWTTLLQPIGERTNEAHAALEKLMEVYRKPIVRFVATQIQDKQQAEDIAHDFIERMLERGDLANADRSKGQFRSYLAKSIKHFVFDQHAAGVTQKRKELNNALSLEVLRTEPSHGQNGEREFVQHWWRATLDEVERMLRAEWEVAGKTELFDELLPLLWDRKDGPPIQVIARKHKLSPSTVSVRKLRLADRYREILLALIRETVNSPAEVQDEIRFLLKDF